MTKKSCILPGSMYFNHKFSQRNLLDLLTWQAQLLGKVKVSVTTSPDSVVACSLTCEYS